MEVVVVLVGKRWCGRGSRRRGVKADRHHGSKQATELGGEELVTGLRPKQRANPVWDCLDFRPPLIHDFLTLLFLPCLSSLHMRKSTRSRSPCRYLKSV